jgi:hypothetical protein
MSITPRPAAPRAEHELVARLDALLGDEYAALEAGDIDALEQVVVAKDRALAALGQALRMTPGMAPPHLPADPALAAAMEKLAAANRRNSRYAAVRLHYVRTRLGGLMQAARPDAGPGASDLYRADGFAGSVSRSGGLYGRA